MSTPIQEIVNRLQVLEHKTEALENRAIILNRLDENNTKLNKELACTIEKLNGLEQDLKDLTVSVKALAVDVQIMKDGGNI